MARPAYDNDKRLAIEADIRERAMTLFARNGYRNVSMRAIAAELGWSATALYRYYDNKEALLAAIRADGFQEIRDMLRAARASAENPVAAAALGMKGYVDFAVSRSALYQLMYELDQGEISAEPGVVEHRRQAFTEAIGIAQDVLGATDVTGDATEMAHLFWINAHGLAALAVAHQLDLGKSLDQLIEPTINALLRGLVPSAG